MPPLQTKSESWEPPDLQGGPEDFKDLKEESQSWSPRNHRPHDPPLPDLSEDNQRVVDAWWDEVTPFFESRDADELLERTLAFLDEQPRLFDHLCLHEAFLFELGAELARRRQWATYTELLMRLRQEQPEMYARSFGYYDHDVITELVIGGRKEEIPDYFSFFERYPDAEPDCAAEIVNLLAWTDCEEQLYEFVRFAAIPLYTSPKVIGGGFALCWLFFHEHLRFLEARDASEQAGRSLRKALFQLNVPDLELQDAGDFRRQLQLATDPSQSERVLSSTRVRDEDFYSDAGWSFCGYLHDQQGLGWVAARFLANQMEGYWYDPENSGSSANPFLLSEKTLDRYLSRNIVRFFNIDGVRAAALLQAMVWFADYLAINGALKEGRVKTVRSMCERLFGQVRRLTEALDPAYRLQPNLLGLDSPIIAPP